MSDNDLIRRSKVRKLLQQCGLMGNHPSDPLAVMFNEIPAAQPDVAALLGAAEKVINSYWHSTDGVITGIYDLEAALARVKGKTK